MFSGTPDRLVMFVLVLGEPIRSEEEHTDVRESRFLTADSRTDRVAATVTKKKFAARATKPKKSSARATYKLWISDVINRVDSRVREELKKTVDFKFFSNKSVL